MARKAAKKPKKKAASKHAKSRAQRAKAPAAKKTRISNAQKMGAFQQAYPSFYAVVFGSDRTFPPGNGLTKLVRQEVGKVATGKWEVLTEAQRQVKFVTVAFANKTDFDAICKKWNAKPASTQLKGAIGVAGVRI